MVIAAFFAAKMGPALSTPKEVYQENLSFPTQRDRFFRKVAEDFQAPEICSKISDDAFTPDWTAPKGEQATFFKSDCFRTLAKQSRDPRLCSYARFLVTPYLDGSKKTIRACLKELKNAQEGEKGSAVGLDNSAMEGFLKELGFDLTQYKSEHRSGELSALAYYSDMVIWAPEPQRQEFILRVKRMPNQPQLSSPGESNHPPVVNIHPEAAASGWWPPVKMAQKVWLDAQSSFDVDREPLTFHWNVIQIPSGSKVQLSETQRPSIQFTPDRIGEYIFEVQVSDAHGANRVRHIGMVALNSIDLEKSTVTASKDELLADGQDSVDIVVSLVGEKGKVAGVPVALFRLKNDVPVLWAEGEQNSETTNAQGKAVFTVRSKAPLGKTEFVVKVGSSHGPQLVQKASVKIDRKPFFSFWPRHKDMEPPIIGFGNEDE